MKDFKDCKDDKDPRFFGSLQSLGSLMSSYRRLIPLASDR